jgi:hypothetical protein
MNTTENKAAATPVVTGTANTIKTETLCSLNENSASEISETSGSSIRDKALSDSVGQEPGTSGASRRVELISDPAMMADFLRTLVQDGGTFEVRALRVRVRYGKPATYSGYYDHGMIDQAVSDVVKLDRDFTPGGRYVSINPPVEAILSRRFGRLDRAESGETTHDNEIAKCITLLVDCDPVRPSGVSSTDAEHAAALERMKEIRDELAEAGWPDPMMVDSGNGGQLWYRIDLPADGGELVKRCLAALGARYDDDEVHVDQTVFNPARIGRIAGTINCKGDDTPTRPHRMAKALFLPRVFTAVSKDQLEALAGPAGPAGASPPHQHRQGQCTRESVQQLIDKHLAECRPRDPLPYKDGVKWILEICPFDPSHDNGSAVITLPADGVPGFMCQHNSCRKRNWRALSEKLGIDARTFTSPINGQAGGRPRAPCPVDVARRFINEALLKEGLPIVRHWKDNWYEYSDKGWVPMTENEMEKRLATWMQSRGGALADHATVTFIRNVLLNLSAFGMCGIAATVDRPCWLSTGEDARNVVAYSNGQAVDVVKFAEALLRGESGKDCIRPVSADLFSTDFVNYPFDPDAGRPELFVKYLKRVCPDPDVYAAAIQMLGMMVADESKYEVFFLMHGGGCNGKTVLLDILEALVGRQNCSYIPIESMAPGNRFQLFPLATAKVNISGEMATDTGRAALASMDEGIPADGDGGEATTLHDVLGSDAEDPSQAAARKIDWAALVANLDARKLGILKAFADGGKLQALARKFRVSAPRITQLKAELARQIKEAWGDGAIADAVRAPSWRAGIAAGRERSLCRHERAILADA